MSNINDFVIENGVLGKYNGTDSVVVIPKGIHTIRQSAFSSNTYIEKVIIPEGVVSIGGWSFNNCSSLVEVVIPSGITKIETCTFANCENLASVTIPNGVTDIGYQSFFGCKKLESVMIPDSVTEVKNAAFFGCKNLKRINLPNGIEKIGLNNFADSLSLKYNEYNNAYYLGNDINPYLLLVKAKDSQIETCEINKDTRFIGCNAFLECANLTDVTIPQGVERIGDDAFALCVSLSNINIPDGVKQIGGNAFRKCESLTNVNIPGSIIEVGAGAFSGCKNIQQLIINDGVLNVRPYAFSGCSGLKALEIHGSLTNIIEPSFLDCHELSSIKLPSNWGEESATWWAKHFNKNVFPLIALDNFGKETKLTKYILKDKALCLNSIIKANRIDLLLRLFEYAKKIDLHILEDAIKIATDIGSVEASAMLIEYKNKSYSIEAAAKIERQTFEKEIGIRKKTVDDYKRMFQFSVGDDCICIKKYLGKSTTVEIPDTIGKRPVTGILESAFTNVSQIVLPKSIKSISSETFSRCKNLKYSEYNNAFYLGTNDNPYYALIKTKGQEIEECEIHPEARLIADGAFKMHRKLKRVSIPARITDFGLYKDDKWYVKWVFADCERLSEIIVSENNPEFKAIDGNLCTKDGSKLIKFFPFGKKRKNITIPNGVVSIGDYAFYGCEKIISVVIPEGVVSIGKDAFKYCSNLTDITLPDSVKHIGDGAFDYCESLESASRHRIYLLSSILRLSR